MNWWLHMCWYLRLEIIVTLVPFICDLCQRPSVMQWNKIFECWASWRSNNCFFWCVFLMYSSLLLSCCWAGGLRGTTGAGVNPMDVRNLSFIRQWRQAGPKYGRVNTNHRSSRDTDTHRPTAINTTHIHKICLCRQMLSCVRAAGQGSHHKRASVGLLQITFFHFFPPLYLSPSSGFLFSLSFSYFSEIPGRVDTYCLHIQ